jgi:opacity protein-like surface antigen
MKQLEKDSNKTNYTTATFKSTRLITGHTIETLGKGILDVRILHRFAPINRGFYDFFGLDYASMRLGFDYGITNNIMVGIGRSAVNMPVTLTFVSTFATRSDLARKDTLNNRILINFADRTSFSEQLIVSRKFSNNFSLQFMPIFIFNHNKIDSINTYTKNKDNIVYGQKRKNTFALGFGGRLKVSKRVAINLEYYYQMPDAKPGIRFNSLSLGVDIETGGHIFQMHFTNANGMTEKSFITDTDDKWRDGYIRFGFNISRVFKVGKS